MVKLKDIFAGTQRTLTELIETRYIRATAHPEFPELEILNYSEKTAYEKNWNEFTLTCRGLIWNKETGDIVARPFGKFFNLGDDLAPTLEELLERGGTVTNKFDGSLGIFYVRPDGRPAIATRGSFASEQAIKATEMLHRTGMAWVLAEASEGFGQTPLYEIIYPENRIVLDYGNVESLVQLGLVDNRTGNFSPDRHNNYANWTPQEALENLNRKNAEGFVIWLDGQTAVKLKQQDYVELHRVVTGLNRKSIWRAERDGTYSKMVEQLPDELYQWADGVRATLMAEYAAIVRRVVECVALVQYQLPSEFTQKDFAVQVQKVVPKELQGLVFSYYAGKAVRHSIWAMIEPKGNEQ